MTGFQRECLQQLVRKIKELNLLHWECADLEKALETTMLNSSMFTQAGTDFVKKMNTLRKCIRYGKWTSPVSSSGPAIDQKPEVSPAR